MLPVLEEEEKGKAFPSIDCLLLAGHRARSFTFNLYNDLLDISILIPIVKIRALKFRLSKRFAYGSHSWEVEALDLLVLPHLIMPLLRDAHD